MSITRTRVDEARERFLDNTADHEMSVLRNDGLYRHLRFKNPEHTIFYFDIVTWPGYLAIVGDAGSYVFCRETDMFGWFGSDFERGISADYWSGKLVAPGSDAAYCYSPDLFTTAVNEWIDSVDVDDRPALRAAVQERIFEHYSEAWMSSEHGAHEVLRDFEHDGLRIDDAWDWRLRDFDYRFLWCCWAILWGISLFVKEHT